MQHPVHEIRFFQLGIGQVYVDDKFRVPFHHLFGRQDGFADDPLSQFREQRVCFQHRDKRVRRNRSVAVVFPAKQRLGADQFLRLRVHHRLIQQTESFITPCDGGPDRVQHLQPMVVFLTQRVFELDHFTLPEGL